MARTVLLADDSVTAQNMGRRILMDAGYEVVTVNNGSAALKKIHESKPDLIVLDVYMPGYGGLEVCQRLKESGETMKIPVLLTVGKMEPFKADEAKRVRADGHIVKPFEASELLAALTRLEDRIVPLVEAPGGRRGKPEKKTRSWHGEDPVAALEEAPTERIAYLSEVKKRRAHEADIDDAAGQVKQESAAPTVSADPPAASTEQTSPATDMRPVAEASAPTEEFAVQLPSLPPESDGQSAPGEFTAEEPRIEAPSIFDAPTVEISVVQTPTSGVPTVNVSAAPMSVGTESIAREPIPDVNAEGPAPAEAPAVTIASSPVSTARWVAENVALTAEEASIALEAEMRHAQAVSATAVTEPQTPAPDQVTSSALAVAQTLPETESVNPSGAAFAAAASAAVSSEPSAVSTQPASAAAGDTAPVNEAEPPVRSEATAAWENWQQIRDSVMSPQKAAAIAESVAEIAQASVPVSEPTAKEDLAAKQDTAPSDSASTAPAEEDNSINDIVDSVLADLKPRLMQEIAKKLAAKK